MANWGAYGSNPKSWGASVAASKKLRTPNQSYVTGQPNTIAPPAPTPKPPDTSLPLDPTYDAVIGGLTQKRDTTISQLEGQKPRVLADYGYTASGYDSTGAPIGLTFDPNNPFSRAALAKRTYDQTQAGTTNSMAARGQLYSGALGQATAGNEFNYQQGTDALIKALTGKLVDIQSGEANAGTDYEIGSGQAYGDRVTRALNTPATPPPAVPAPVGLPGAGGNPYKPGTSEWAAYASKNGQSWKQSGGKWYRKNAAGGWTPAG